MNYPLHLYLLLLLLGFSISGAHTSPQADKFQAGSVKQTEATPALIEEVGIYYSRPDIRPPLLDIHVNCENASPGYIFVSPNSNFHNGGPTIYDSSGELVWSSTGDGLLSMGTGFHVCDYQGVKGRHLCFFDGHQQGEYAHGKGIILDAQYRIIKVVQTIEGTDMHEFRLIEQGMRALVTKYRTVAYDLDGFVNPHEMRAVQDSVFLEMDIESGSASYEWHSLDHIVPTETVRLNHSAAGIIGGLSYDYFHINSVDKNEEGDYLISSRHTSSIFKISGADGRVIWTLSNGPESTFQLIDFSIWGQHHVRWVSENMTHSILTIFNNGRDGLTNNAEQSTALMILLNHISYEASVLRQYFPPKSFLSPSQGSIQRLSDGNIFVGWGAMNHLSEYSEDGTLVFHAAMPGGASYRAFKSVWTGVPLDPPILWTYAQTKDSQMVFYVTWNGDTETRTWRFYVNVDTNKATAFTLAGTKERTGFETRFSVPSYHQWAFVESVAADGKTLRNSSIVPTWTPGPTLQASCDEWKCPQPDKPSKSKFKPDAILMDSRIIDSLQECQERSRSLNEELEALGSLNSKELGHRSLFILVIAAAISLLMVTVIWLRSCSWKGNRSGYILLLEENS